MPPSVVLILTLLAAGPAPSRGRQPAAPQAVAEKSSEQAGKERARALLQEGNRLLDEGKYLEALARFTAAFEAFPSPKLQFNMAQTCIELGRTLEALDHYEKFVQGTKDEGSSAELKLAHEKIFQLQGRIATVAVQANLPEVLISIDGIDQGQTPLLNPIRLLPGPHALVATKAGYEKQVVELKLKEGEALSQRLKMLTEAESAATKKAVQQAEQKRKESEQALLEARARESAARATSHRRLQLAGWGSLGIGGAAVLGGAVAALVAQSDAAAVEAAAPGTYWSDVEARYSRGEALRKGSYWAFGVGGALMVTGLAIQSVIGSPPAADQAANLPEISASLTPGSAGLNLSWSWR